MVCSGEVLVVSVCLRYVMVDSVVLAGAVLMM